MAKFTTFHLMFLSHSEEIYKAILSSLFLVSHWPLLCPMLSRLFKMQSGLNKREKD